MNLSANTDYGFNFLFFSPDNFSKHTLHLPHIQTQLKSVFLTSIEANMQQLNAEICEERFQNLHKTMHMLKGTVSIFCVDSLKNELNTLAHSAASISKKEYLDRVNTAMSAIAILAHELQSFQRPNAQSQNETLN
jgi:hypothetical protein